MINLRPLLFLPLGWLGLSLICATLPAKETAPTPPSAKAKTKPESASLQEAIQAATSGDAEAMKQWLASGGNPNQTDAEGWSPLHIAAARGHAKVVEVLLNSPKRKADPHLAFAPSGAWPIHLAGQSGDVATAKLLLSAHPEDVNQIWLLNGHTLLLQAAFYGHVEMAQLALDQGANPAATTLRGLTAMDFAHQFNNSALMTVLAQKPADPAAKADYFAKLLAKIREPVPAKETAAQALSDKAAEAIVSALASAGNAPETVDALERDIAALLEGMDVNRLAGDLRQPLLVVTVTGNNAGPHPEAAAELRLRIARLLLKRGADPLRKEKHPMGAHAIIRASVFGHLEILKLMGSKLTEAQLASGLNEIPAVNGLTALHDAVLRSGTVADPLFPRYMDQIRWEIASGARADIPDFSGRTQLDYAEFITDATRKEAVLDVLKNPRATPQWNHASIAVPSLEEAACWYENVFGFVALSPPKTHTPANDDAWKVATSIFGDDLQKVRLVRMRASRAPLQQVIEIFEVHPTPAPDLSGKRKSGYVHACMIVGDVGMIAARVEDQGGKILSHAFLGSVEITFCQDPYGNIIELASAPW
jgi:ankyrin repeat protein